MFDWLRGKMHPKHSAIHIIQQNGTSSSQQHLVHKSMKTLKLNGFKRQVAVILMMLTTIDFLVGENTNIFLPGNKIGRMHTQYTR